MKNREKLKNKCEKKKVMIMWRSLGHDFLTPINEKRERK